MSPNTVKLYVSDATNFREFCRQHKVVKKSLAENVFIGMLIDGMKPAMGAVRFSSLCPKFIGSHFGLPPSSINRMTEMGGNLKLTMTYWYVHKLS